MRKTHILVCGRGGTSGIFDVAVTIGFLRLEGYYMIHITIFALSCRDERNSSTEQQHSSSSVRLSKES